MQLFRIIFNDKKSQIIDQFTDIKPENIENIPMYFTKLLKDTVLKGRRRNVTSGCRNTFTYVWKCDFLNQCPLLNTNGR